MLTLDILQLIPLAGQKLGMAYLQCKEGSGKLLLIKTRFVGSLANIGLRRRICLFRKGKIPQHSPNTEMESRQAFVDRHLYHDKMTYIPFGFRDLCLRKPHSDR